MDNVVARGGEERQSGPLGDREGRVARELKQRRRPRHPNRAFNFSRESTNRQFFSYQKIFLDDRGFLFWSYAVLSAPSGFIEAAGLKCPR